MTEGYVTWCERCHKFVVDGYCWACNEIYAKDHVDLEALEKELGDDGVMQYLRASIVVADIIYGLSPEAEKNPLRPRSF